MGRPLVYIELAAKSSQIPLTTHHSLLTKEKGGNLVVIGFSDYALFRD